MLLGLVFVACSSPPPAPPEEGPVRVPELPAPPLAPTTSPTASASAPAPTPTTPVAPAKLPPELGAPCDPKGHACGPSGVCCLPCCLPDAVPVCSTPDPKGRCPQPDLVVDETLLRSSVAPGTYDAKPDGCGVQMGCVSGTGKRKLLRFTTSAKNGGNGTFYLGRPQDYPERFKWFACEQNWRVEGYTEFRLVDHAGTVVARGKKDGYCLMDALNVSATGGPTYTCADQGITPGWADIYANGDDCEWVDVTDVQPGDYTLEVEVDPSHQWPESNEKNNIARVPVHLAAD